MTDDDKAQAELKPCPFCGGDACLSAEKGLWLVFCLSSKHEVSTGFFETQAEAVNAWNTRTDEAIRMTERAAIVAWLREQGITKDEYESKNGWWWTPTGAQYGASILEAIEAGDHLK